MEGELGKLLDSNSVLLGLCTRAAGAKRDTLVAELVAELEEVVTTTEGREAARAVLGVLDDIVPSGAADALSLGNLLAAFEEAPRR